MSENPDSNQRLREQNGSSFFGIDGQYMTKVQKREIFELVGHGFSYESLVKMPIEERRFYYHQYVEKHMPKDLKNQPPPGKLNPNNINKLL